MGPFCHLWMMVQMNEPLLRKKNILVSEKDFPFSLFLVPIIFQQKILNEILASDFLYTISHVFGFSLFSLVFTKHKLSI